MGAIILIQVEDRRYGLDLKYVEKILPAVEVTKLPKEDDNVTGVINVQGVIISVMYMRKLLGLAQRDIEINDRIILCTCEGQKRAVVVDAVIGLYHHTDEDCIPASQMLSDFDDVEYVIKKKGEIILVYNLKKRIKPTTTIPHG